MSQHTVSLRASIVSGVVRSLIFLGALLTFPTISTATEGFETPVGFAVSPTGAANFNIPIDVPPGTAGMAPSLSLNYNSQDGNGILGMGWSLHGLPSITRCGTTLIQDGNAGVVSYTANDRFCLDGQRLVVVANASGVTGVYGANLTEYRTERESFTRVVSYGSAGSGPAYFKAWTKAGQIIEFGNTTNSAIEAQGRSDIRVWAVNKISDTSGNYMTVSYTEDNANGDYRPLSISYTGNSTAIPAVATYNSVQFVYQTRPDITPLYRANSVIKTMMRLITIQAYANVGGVNTLVKKYNLSYANSALPNNASRLVSEQECPGDGTACLPATNLGWQTATGTTGIATTPATGWGVQGTTAELFASGDFNGDGLGDLLYATYTISGLSVYVQYSTGTGFSAPVLVAVNKTQSVNTTYPNNGVVLAVGDVNGDGKADVILGNGMVYLSTGSSFASGVTLGPNCPSGNILSSGDFNGDGLADLVCTQPGESMEAFVYLSTGSGFNYSRSILSYTLCVACTYALATVGDVNGDGKADVILGDGNVYLSTGSGFAPGVAWGARVSGVKNFYTADLNGDGLADLLTAVYTTSGNYQAQFSTGIGFANSIVGLTGGFTAPQVAAADVNGDGKVDVILGNGYVMLSTSATPDLLNSVTTGQGVNTTIVYKQIADPTVYTAETDGIYPVQDMTVQKPLYVVSSVVLPDGIGGTRTNTYKYYGAKTHLTGGGFLGFGQYDMTDSGTSGTGILTRTVFRQDYPYQGLPISVTKIQSNGNVLHSVANTWSFITYPDTVLPVPPATFANTKGSKHHFSYLGSKVETSYDLVSGQPVTVQATSNTYDSFGNATQVTTTTNDNYSKTAINTYTNDIVHWYIGQLTLSTLTSTTPSGASLTRTAAFTYYAANGLLWTETIEPNNAALQFVDTFKYDSYGNKNSTAISGTGIPSRTTSTLYDAQGRFPVKVTNALNQVELRAFDARFGTVTQVTDPNLLVSNFKPDSFGRPSTGNGPDLVVTTTTRGLCPVTGCPTLAAYYVTVSKPGTPTVTTYFDKLNRQVRTQTTGFNGTNVLKDTAYDNLGRVYTVSRPYYSGGSIAYTTYSYDLLNRVKTITDPQTNQSKVVYTGLTTTTTSPPTAASPSGENNTTVKNSQGELVTVTDALNHTISYTYDPFGNLLTTTDPANNVTTLTYDLRGRKTGMNDPDMGVWSYTYDVLGELITQTDAKGQVTTNTYDLLGRMTHRAEPDLNTTWEYDTASKGIGEIASTTTDNGQTRTFYYDTLGRLTTTSTQPGAGAAVLNVSTSYDTFGRVSIQTTPAGFQVQNVYNAQGYLSQVVDAQTLRIYWTATALWPDGQLNSATFGNGATESRTIDSLGRTTAVNDTHTLGGITALGYTYDPLNNLTIRTDATQNLIENYGYDALNRITSVTSTNPNQAAKSYVYDALGNISSKSDNGIYTYGALHADGTAIPHAVTSISGSWNTNFTYDQNGNMTTGGDRNYIYTSFNLPSAITRAIPNNGITSIIYGADHERAMETGPDGTVTISLNPRLDSGVTYDQRTHPNGVTEDVNYIYAGNRPIGIYSINANGVQGTYSLRYIHVDAQGSITALSEGNVETGGSNTVVVGFGPRATIFNPVTNKIYVTNFGSGNNVTVIDGATNITTTVATGTNPLSVAVNPTTNMTYVANYSSANVTVINGATNATATVAVGTNPYAIAVNPVTNKIYVTNYGSANVTVINGATNATATVATGSGTHPLGVAVNSVTNKIYVTNYSSNTVTVIDGATNTTTTVATGSVPYYVAVNSVTNKMYVSNAGSANVTVIDGATNTTTTVAVGSTPEGIVVNPVTNKIYVTNYSSNTVTVIDGATNTPTTVATGTNPIAITVNPVTNKIYVGNYGSSNVTMIDGATNIPTTLAAGTTPWSIAANPVTNKIYVGNYGSSNVTVISTATSQIVVERLSYDAWGKRRNPDGTDDTTNNLQALNTAYGYTEQEHLDAEGLIHMSGRVYDPRLGRFLEADPYIQAPGNLQSYNRYAYVMNNPFLATDPSGFCGEDNLYSEDDSCGWGSDTSTVSSSSTGSTDSGQQLSDQLPSYAGMSTDGAGIPNATVGGDGTLSKDIQQGDNGVSGGNATQTIAQWIIQGGEFVNDAASSSFTFVDQSVQSWWNASMAGFQSENLIDGTLHTLAGLPVDGIAVGAVGGIKGLITDVQVGGAATGIVQEETQLYRVFGGDAQGFGNYFTTVNPANVADFRTTAGLFPGNSGSFVLEGTLNDTKGVLFDIAAPGPGGVGGGLPQVYVPNPAFQIIIQRVSGVNPPF